MKEFNKKFNIIKVYYYVIKIVSQKANKIFFKIGETRDLRRPQNLVKKYSQLRANSATQLCVEELPHNNKKRLNDKLIQTSLDPSVLSRVDPAIINNYLCLNTTGDKTDCTEFFELKTSMTDDEIISYIEKVVAEIKKASYTTNVLLNYDLEYDDPVEYHLVNDKFLDKIENYTLNKTNDYKVKNILQEGDLSKKILLIGQFEPDFVSFYAGRHEIFLWHDSTENTYIYKYELINKKIHYITNLEELLILSEDIKFDLIIANPPYGRIGTYITEEVIKNVDFDEYVNLLPMTNYRLSSSNLQKHVSPEEMEIVFDAFDGVAVLPVIAKVYKEEVNNLTPTEFRIETQQDLTTKKYFLKNKEFEKTFEKMLNVEEIKQTDGDLSKIIYLPMRLTNKAFGGHTGTASIGPTKNTAAFKVAFDLISNIFEMSNDTPNLGTYILFKTKEEKRNCGEFLFGEGYKLTLWLLNSMRVDAANKAEHEFWFPKVDWTKKWTLDEILNLYGYVGGDLVEVKKKISNYPDFKK